MEAAYLNRANARLELQSYSAARDDYVEYLRLDPATPQREPIEKLIALLGGMLDEQARLEAGGAGPPASPAERGAQLPAERLGGHPQPVRGQRKHRGAV